MESSSDMSSRQDGSPWTIQNSGQTWDNGACAQNTQSYIDNSSGSTEVTPSHRSRFQCQYCDKAFPFKSRLDRHVLAHTGETPFHCDICGKGFKQKRNMLCHKISAH